MDATVEHRGATVAISSQRYAPGVVHPDGACRIEAFTNELWPTWRYRIDSTLVIEQSLFVPKGLSLTVLRWRVHEGPPEGRLRVRPFLAGRDYHSLHHQILAIGGLPFAVLDGPRARRVVDEVERQLWTPLGLRSLSPADPAYVGRYAGGVAARDGAYHQGTAWPWLLGPFVEAWVRVRGNTAAARAEARTRFLDPLLTGLTVAGLGHLPEVADGDAPHHPGGCPFQAWSVGEAVRLDRLVLRVDAATVPATPRRLAGIESSQ